jgi:hypothetical protein
MRRSGILVLSVALAGCTLIGLEHNDPPPPANHTGAWDAVLIVDAATERDGPLVKVEDALDRVGGDPVHVRGVLFIDDLNESVWLCARALQPQPECQGAILLVQWPGSSFNPSAILEAASVHDLQMPYPGLRWAEDVTIFGRVVEAAGSTPDLERSARRPPLS